MKAILLSLIFAAAALAQNSHQVSLSCTASTSPGVTGYNFFRSTVSGGPYTQLNVAPVATCSYVDGPATTFTEGASYFYVATAVGNGGTQSVYSNEVKATIPFLPPSAPVMQTPVPK